MQVMFVPQKAIAAPGATLLEQLIYPAILPADAASLDKQGLTDLLDQVGLTDLLQRVQGNWLLNHKWQGTVPAVGLSCMYTFADEQDMVRGGMPPASAMLAGRI